MATAIIKRFSHHNDKVLSTENKKPAMTLSQAANTASATRKLFWFNKNIQQKTVKIEETSNPKHIKRYLKTMTKSTFRGDVESNTDTIDAKEKQRRTDLGKVMKKLSLMIEGGKAFSIETRETIDEVAKLRSAGNSVALDENSYKEKLRQDYVKFLDYREDSIIKIEECKLKESPTKIKPVATLNHDDFWGTRQQLRSGKVVGDMLGGLDPVFGVLLNPTGK